MATTKKGDANRRPERVASRMQQELARVLAQDFTDPRLKDVVVAGVTVTDDLSLARVAFVVMGDDADGSRARAARKVLQTLTGAVRAKLAPRLGMRRVPTVQFDLDVGREEVMHLDSLLHEVSEELKKSGG